MVAVAKKTSQVVAHMAIAFSIAYAMTGSLMFSGMAVIIEPVINVLLLPFHERAWQAVHSRAKSERERYLRIAGEKVSQTLMHMAVAFAVIYCATGSLAFGGAAAILEPVCNVLLLPVHDRFWNNMESRLSGRISVA